jgi:hypothetical protein
VNPSNLDSVAGLPELEEAWDEQGCDAMAWECDAGICWVPDGSGCMSPGPGSGEGVCSDLFAN